MATWIFLLLLPLNSQASTFRFHMFVESQHGVDPQLATGASGNYLLQCLYRGLFVYDSKKGLQPAGADKCVRSPRHLKCRLNPAYRWSDGKVVRADEYVAAFRRLIDPKMASPQSGSISSLKNARAIRAGRVAVEKLGVSAPDSKTLLFAFDEDDPEFEYKLIHPALSPLPPSGYPPIGDSDKLIVNGPYKITRWKRGSFVRLEPNPYYPSKAKNRPDVEAYFVDDDATALTLYESGKLDFLRRLTATDIPRYQGKPDFYQISMARFDYVGFGPALLAQESLRSALVHGVDFSTFTRLFITKTSPGCPSLPARFEDRPTCQTFDPAAAKTSLAQGVKPKKLEFHFSRMGGDDISRSAEWFQGEWQKSLNLRVDLFPEEQSVYLSHLKANPPAIFRKGISLDRPTCLAALELFTKGNPENYIRLDDPDYERKVQVLAHSSPGPAQRKACREAVDYLLQTNRLIPLGEFYFTILVKPAFTGWALNELNQLDLSELEGPAL